MNAFIAFIAAIGAGGWVYAKTQRKTGNNSQTSLTVAAIVGVLAFIVVLILLGFIPEA